MKKKRIVILNKIIIKKKSETKPHRLNKYLLSPSRERFHSNNHNRKQLEKSSKIKRFKNMKM